MPNQRRVDRPHAMETGADVVSAVRHFESVDGIAWTLRNSSGVGKGIGKSVVQSGRDFPYIRVGGGQ